MKAPITEFLARPKYINMQQHPSLPLYIWNYTPACQFANAWDEYTEMARGLITDEDGNIVARPFRKFFNIGQREVRLPSGDPEVFEKMDGSLGILYWDGNLPCIATRGSFTSDQALWATKWIRDQLIDPDDFDHAATYLFEIIYPSNRIVVNYGDRAELVLLAVINTATGEELDHIVEARRLGFVYAKKYPFTNFGELMKSIPENEEGYVLRYPNGYRVKIKGPEYVRLHRILTGITSRRIWELLAAGDDIDRIIENVPDEFYKWVKDEVFKLKAEHQKIRHRIEMQHDVIFHKMSNPDDRKAYAEIVMQDYKSDSGLMFALYNGKDIHDMIWKLIRPAHVKPFIKDIDN